MPLYKVTSPSRKVYIGITTLTVRRRMTGHKTAARSGSIYPLHAAIRKYGFDKMQVEILNSETNLDALHALEIASIAEFNCVAPNGYNLTAGGEGTLNHVVTDNHKAHLSSCMSARWLDPDFKAMRSKKASELAKQMSPEHRAALNAGASKYWSNPENHARRTARIATLRAEDPARFANQCSGLVAYNKSNEGRAAKAKSTSAARALQSAEKRSEVGRSGGATFSANRKAFLESLSPEARELEIARFKAERSAATKAGRAAATPEQKAASKERYRQAALRRTIHPRKLKAK